MNNSSSRYSTPIIELIGSSSTVKPTKNIPNGTLFYEWNTGKTFCYDARTGLWRDGVIPHSYTGALSFIVAVHLVNVLASEGFVTQIKSPFAALQYVDTESGKGLSAEAKGVFTAFTDVTFNPYIASDTSLWEIFCGVNNIDLTKAYAMLTATTDIGAAVENISVISATGELTTTGLQNAVGVYDPPAILNGDGDMIDIAHIYISSGAVSAPPRNDCYGELIGSINSINAGVISPPSIDYADAEFVAAKDTTGVLGVEDVTVNIADTQSSSLCDVISGVVSVSFTTVWEYLDAISVNDIDTFDVSEIDTIPIYI